MTAHMHTFFWRNDLLCDKCVIILIQAPFRADPETKKLLRSLDNNTLKSHLCTVRKHSLGSNYLIVPTLMSLSIVNLVAAAFVSFLSLIFNLGAFCLLWWRTFFPVRLSFLHNIVGNKRVRAHCDLRNGRSAVCLWPWFQEGHSSNKDAHITRMSNKEQPSPPSQRENLPQVNECSMWNVRYLLPG